MSKIHIFYRHTEKNKINNGRPEWFNYEKCFVNLLRTIENYRDRITLTVIMDGEISENFIEKYREKYDLHSMKFYDAIKSHLGLIHYLRDNKSKFNDDDILYTLENDYLHLNDWTLKIDSLYKKYGNVLSYVTLYDHNDKYFYPQYSNLTSQILVTDDHHWRVVSSTTATYMVKAKIYFDDLDIWLKGQEDHPTFLYLQQHKNRCVVSPVPGISTHCMTRYLSPTVDWKSISDSIVL